MSRRFAGAGLSRRPGRGSSVGSVSAALPTPLEVLGVKLVHEWHWSRDYLLNGSNYSQVDNQVGSGDLVQGTVGSQPAQGGTDPRFYSTSVSADYLVATIADIGGGDLCMIDVARAAAGTDLFHGGVFSAASVGKMHLRTSGTNLAASFVDASGSELVGPGAAPDGADHIYVAINKTGVSRRFIVDGTVYNGARTLAINIGADRVSCHANPGGVSAANGSRYYYRALCKPVPTDAELNAVCAYLAQEFALTWTPV